MAQREYLVNVGGKAHLSSTSSTRPAASAINNGVIHAASDTGDVSYSTGSAWVALGKTVVPGAALIPNGGFERGVSPWSGGLTGVLQVSATSVLQDAAQSKSGGFSMAVTVPVTSGNKGVSTDFGARASGRQCTASVWVYTTTAQTVYVTLQDNLLGNGTANTSTAVAANTWTELTLTWTPSAAGTQSRLYVYLTGAAAAQTFYVDAVMVAEGSTAVSYLGSMTEYVDTAIPYTYPYVINAQTGTTYTLVLSDQSKLVSMNNAAASTLTVPPYASVPWPLGTTLEIAQLGAGQVTVAAGAGVTINPATKLKVNGQYGAASLINVALNSWLMLGGIA